MSDRIAVLSSSYPRSADDAGGHFVHSEVRGLVHAGHEVHVFAPGGAERGGRAEHDGAHVHWLADRDAFGWPGAWPRLKQRPARLLGIGEFALRARRALQSAGSFDRLQAHFLLPSGWPIATLAFPPRSRTEIELVGHGSDVRLFCRLPKQLRKHIARGWLARGARLRLTSHELAALVQRANPELGAVLTVAPSPIEVAKVPGRSAARKRLGLAGSDRIAVIVSRLIPDKRVGLALEALAVLSGLSVIVVGDGPQLGALRARFPRVRFTGRLLRSEALCFIAAADVLVSASAAEGAPTVVREARALGVPVVAINAGDLALWAKSDAGIVLVGG